MSIRSNHIVLLVFGLAGCGRTASDSTKPPAVRVHVETVVATEQDVPAEVTLTGVLAANERTELAANASGRVVKVFVEIGQRVKAGSPIAQLDARSAVFSSREASANVQTAADRLASSKKDCDRYQGLLAKGAITQQEYDRATGQCESESSSEIAARAGGVGEAERL